MIAALEFDDLLTAGYGTSHSQGVEGGFRSRIAQQNLLGQGNVLVDLPRHLDFQFGGTDSGQHAPLQGLDDPAPDPGMVMAEERRAKRTVKIRRTHCHQRPTASPRRPA